MTALSRPSASEGCAMSSVAVKNPDTSSPSVLDRLHVGDTNWTLGLLLEF